MIIKAFDKGPCATLSKHLRHYQKFHRSAQASAILATRHFGIHQLAGCLLIVVTVASCLIKFCLSLVVDSAHTQIDIEYGNRRAGGFQHRRNSRGL